MRGKPIAVNSGLTVRHDIKPGSGEDSLVFSGSGLSGPLYLGTTSLHNIFQHMGREAVLRLLGEPELPVGQPPAPGTKAWADKMRAMEPLSTHVWGMADQLFAHKRHIKALEDQFQKDKGLLGQALGRIEKLEERQGRIREDLNLLGKNASREGHYVDSLKDRLERVEGLLGQALGRIEVLEVDWEYAVKDRNDTRQYVTKQRQSIEKLGEQLDALATAYVRGDDLMRGRIEKLEAELTGIRVRIDRIVIGFTDHDHLLSERIKELTERVGEAEKLLMNLDMVAAEFTTRLVKLEGNDTATAHRLQVTVERTEGLEERLKREIKAVLRLITKNRELSTRSCKVLGERLSALEVPRAAELA